MKLKNLFENSIFYFSEFCKNWIYPAYYLKILLWNRYDIVRLKELKPYHYCDADYRMLLANMTLIVDFIEKEKPEEKTVWYKDEEDRDVGARHLETKNNRIYLLEYNGKYIMDIIKEIYHWWKVDYPLYKEDYEYILHFFSEYVRGDMIFDEKDESDGTMFIGWDNKKAPKILEDIEHLPDIRWDILDRHFQRKDLFKTDYVRDYITMMENKMINDEQKYLHLGIEVRPYLWT